MTSNFYRPVFVQQDRHYAILNYHLHFYTKDAADINEMQTQWEHLVIRDGN